MAKFVDEMAESGGIWQNISEVWQNMARNRRNLAENCEILAESGGKERNLAECGEIWRNILKIKKLRNLRKKTKYGDICR